MKNNLFLYCPLILSFFYQNNFCQEVKKDTELWTNVQLSAPIQKDWEADVSSSWRQEEQGTTFNQAFIQLRATYQTPLSPLSLTAGYRYIVRPNEEDNDQRWFLDTYLKKRFKSIRISSRTRFQVQYSNAPEWQNTKRLFREKIKIAYRKKKKSKWSPYLESELFFDTGQQWHWQRYRAGGGISWRFAKRQKLDASFRLERKRAIEKKSPKRIFLIALEYEYILKSKKR